MRTLAVAVSAAASLTAACAPPAAELTDAERSAIVEEITAVLDSFWDSWRAADYDRGMSFYLDSPETAFTSHGLTLVGFATINETFRPVFEDVERQEMDLDKTHINVLSRDVVHVTESGSYTQIDNEGVRGRTAPFSFSATWILRDGEWKMVTCHQSERLPQTE